MIIHNNQQIEMVILVKKLAYLHLIKTQLILAIKMIE